MEIIQYNIVLVNLDPTVGSEIKKTRPCVIISPDEMNKYLGSTTLNFISYKGMINATGLKESMFSTSCFNGKYPIDIKQRRKEVNYPIISSKDRKDSSFLS